MRQPRLFISCSRSDRAIADALSGYLRRAYDEVWFDEHRYGGDVWWDEILWNIRACDMFLYLVSPEAIRAAYCQAEYAEAVRLHKPVLPLIIRPVPVVPAELKPLQPLDLTHGIDSGKVGEVLAALRGLENKLQHVPQPPLAPEPTPTPRVDDEPRRRSPLRWVIVPALGVVLLGAAGWLAPQFGLFGPTYTPTASPTATSFVPTATLQPPTATVTRITATREPSETPLWTVTSTPSPIEATTQTTLTSFPAANSATPTLTASTMPTVTVTVTPQNTPTVTPTLSLQTRTSTVPPTVTRRVTASSKAGAR